MNKRGVTEQDCGVWGREKAMRAMVPALEGRSAEAGMGRVAAQGLEGMGHCGAMCQGVLSGVTAF